MYYYRIIESLTKEESRYYKLFVARTYNNSERKDTQLFDFIKKMEKIMMRKKYRLVKIYSIMISYS